MKIKSMTATFGCLDHAHLELDGGLNLIYAPNEGGKSTWTAFWKAMLYGIDTRDRDKKGYLADKNRYQPWSGAPMEGEIRLEHQGQDITIRRGPKGNTPFGSFSAVYTATGEKVPGLTASNCGSVLTGASRAVFERSALIGAGSMAVTSTPELEKRIAALVSSGQEDVSYSQVEARLREWLNRRQVNRSVGLIPKLEGELQEVSATLSQLESVTAELSRLEGEKVLWESRRTQLEGEAETYRRMAQRELDQRYAQAGAALEEATAQLHALEAEYARFRDLPNRDRLKQAQGELQYLKVLDDELKREEADLSAAQAHCDQVQANAQSDLFPGLSGEEAVRQAQQTVEDYRRLLSRAKSGKTAGVLLLALGLLTGGVAAGAYAALIPLSIPTAACYGLLGGGALFAVAGLVSLLGSGKARRTAQTLLTRYNIQAVEELTALAGDYRIRHSQAEEARRRTQAMGEALAERRHRREMTHTALLDFVHTFEPQVNNLFGCSAALSRALSVEHELTLARERVEERRRRREDLAAQGGKDYGTLELLAPPAHSQEEVTRALIALESKLEQVNGDLHQARGRLTAMGDPAALSARQEELEAALTRRQGEFDALNVALDTLKAAHSQLQSRFAPDLDQVAGGYLSRLTGEKYEGVALGRDLEGEAARRGDVLPHSVLYLSRGTADQLYLAVRLAVCRLCLPERPPIVLDDALTAFDDQRLVLALDLLRELAQQQQILLFTCHRRESEVLSEAPSVHKMAL